MGKKKCKGKSNNGIFYVVISLAIVLGVGTLTVSTIVKATTGQSVVQNIQNYYEAQNGNVVGDINQAPTEDMSLGAAAGTDVTIDNLELGSAVSAPLRFVEGATTTPGGLFDLYNNGPTKDCSRVELELSTASTKGGLLGTGLPLSFSVSTSTAGTSYNNVGVSIIATTTAATGTTMLADSVNNKGTYAATAGQSFTWAKGVHLLGQYSILSGSPATTTSYGMAGRVYAICHISK